MVSKTYYIKIHVIMNCIFLNPCDLGPPNVLFMPNIWLISPILHFTLFLSQINYIFFNDRNQLSNKNRHNVLLSIYFYNNKQNKRKPSETTIQFPAYKHWASLTTFLISLLSYFIVCFNSHLIIINVGISKVIDFSITICRFSQLF